VEVWEGGTQVQHYYFGRKFRGLFTKTLWYRAEKHAAAEASDLFLK